MARITSTDVIYMILKSGGETYVFSFDEASKELLLGIVARMAWDKELAFGWREAFAVKEKVREVFA